MEKPMNLLRANVRHLMGSRSINSVAEAAGVPQSWLQRLLNPDKPGGTQSRTNPEHLEKLARHLGVTPAQLMFQNLTETPSAPSQSAGLEEEIMAAAAKLVWFLDELLRGMGLGDQIPSLTNHEAQGRRLFVAAQIAREEGAEAILDGSKLAEASTRLAARLRAMG